MSVRIEANGTWTAQVWYRDYSGAKRHKTKRGFPSEEEAESWEAEFARDAEGAVRNSIIRPGAIEPCGIVPGIALHAEDVFSHVPPLVCHPLRSDAI